VVSERIDHLFTTLQFWLQFLIGPKARALPRPAAILTWGCQSARFSTHRISLKRAARTRATTTRTALTAGDRYVKLAFQVKGNASNGERRVPAPKLPAQAVPGVYALYIVDTNGVPSVGR
jgi:hypothetical protein